MTTGRHLQAKDGYGAREVYANTPFYLAYTWVRDGVRGKQGDLPP